jgi:hypothetical protein
MGIYTNGDVYGICIYTHNDNDDIYTLYEKKQDVIMNAEQIKEAYFYYANLYDKTNISFKLYTECSTTYAPETFMMWHPISLPTFVKLFGRM